MLEIKDTGIGMSEDTLLRIFGPFERLGSVRNAEGFGLGLPITKGLVNLLGGTIAVSYTHLTISKLWDRLTYILLF